jgi:broad specificity phosphatase PhoE
MRRLLGVALLIVLAAAAPADGAQAHGTILLLRHAPKLDGSSDSPLSEAGLARAQTLASLLEGAGVTAIYTTQYRRTIDTAAPLAKATGVESVIISGKETAALVERLRASAPDDLIVVVGHSNTIPEILSGLGCVDVVAIGDTEYEDLFVILPRGEGPPAMLRLKY